MCLLFKNTLNLFKNHFAHNENTTDPQITVKAVKIYAITPSPNKYTR